MLNAKQKVFNNSYTYKTILKNSVLFFPHYRKRGPVVDIYLLKNKRSKMEMKIRFTW